MKRRKFSSEFKSKVALEALKGLKTLNEIAREYEVHPNQISTWKKQLPERLPQLFSEKPWSSSEHDREKEMLYQQIGQLQVELTWLKKKVNIINS
ncbi:MAG: transposase [Candidatus Marinimicrobia bacterium]|nr:transposase [Candidatus Neomarinimicrobiota bacterium]